MRILLDGCMPTGFRWELTGHQVWTAQELRLAGVDDGPLLDAIDGRFDLLVTVDKSLPQQQALARRSFRIAILRARSNRLSDLKELAPKLLAAIPSLVPGTATEIF